ncbi:MAG: VWA domain-containing protein [Vicinamibacterales bacterium]
MSSVEFLHPEAAWAFPIAAAALAVLWTFGRRRFVATATTARLGGAIFRASAVRRLPVLVAGASLALIIVAMMDPVWPHASERVETRGVDIALVLDLSSSMEEVMGTAGNVAQRHTRLDVTKRAIADFIRARPGDRIALIVFSDNAYVVSPLTVDHGYLQRYVSMIDHQTLRGEGMTAIGEGLSVATRLLARQAPPSPRDRVILVFTDGENTYGRDPVAAIGRAQEAGYRVHLVGVDLEEEVKAKPEVLRLVRRVRSQGGRYFTADTAGQLGAAARAIDALEGGSLVATRPVRNQPLYAAVAASALILLCSAFLLRSFPFFVDLT